MPLGAKLKRESTHVIKGSRRTFIKEETSYGSLIVVRVVGETSAGFGNFSDQSVLIGKVQIFMSFVLCTLPSGLSRSETNGASSTTGAKRMRHAMKNDVTTQ